MEKRDTIHINSAPLDGRNKDFNFIISPREDGKTTNVAVFKWWVARRKWGSTPIFLRRQVADITTEYIDSLQKTVNKYFDESFKIKYKESEIDKGIVHVMDQDGNLAFYVIGLSKKVTNLKSLVIPNCPYIFLDEAICDPAMGETYLKGEAKRIKELYNTVYRENKGDNGRPRLKFYALGNPYSLYNPLLVDWGVDTNKLKIKGEPDESIFLEGDVWCVWRKTLSRELYDEVLKHNAGYRLGADFDYTDYALNGLNVNDSGLRIKEKKPNGYRLKHLIRCASRVIGIWENTNWIDRENRFYACYVKDISKYRDIFVFDFEKMVSQSILFSATEKMHFAHLRESVRKRTIEYASIEIAYQIQEIYTYL